MKVYIRTSCYGRSGVHHLLVCVFPALQQLIAVFFVPCQSLGCEVYTFIVGNQSTDVPSLLAVDYKSAVRNTAAGWSQNKDGFASRCEKQQ